MRLFELVLSVANLLTFVVFAVPKLRNNRRLSYMAPIAMTAALLQMLIEGPRWQMVPAYILALAFLSLWLTRRFMPVNRKSRRGFFSRLLMWASVALGTLVFLISVALPAALPVFQFPKPSGPYQIGTVTYHWTDESRHEIFSTNLAAKRQLMAQVWYPVQGDTSSDRAPYVDDAGALSTGATNALASGGLVRLPDFFFDYFKYIKTNAIPSAPIAKNEPAYPVLIYLTGLDGWRSVSMFQIQDLVSHGYIVVGLDQPYTAAAVTFPDGQVVKGLTKARIQPLIDQSVAPTAPAPALNGEPMPDGVIPYLAQDVSFTLGKLNAIDRSDPNGVLTGRLNMSDTGAFGISLGAIVAAQACHQDRRLGACLMMDAAMPADVVQSGLQQPSMWLTRDANTMRLERKESGGWTEAEIRQTLDTMQAAFNKSLHQKSYYVTMPGMFHVNFTDTPYWSPFTSQAGITGPINSDAGFDAVNAYTLAFFNRTLEEQSPPLLNGLSKQPANDIVTVH